MTHVMVIGAMLVLGFILLIVCPPVSPVAAFVAFLLLKDEK